LICFSAKIETQSENARAPTIKLVGALAFFIPTISPDTKHLINTKDLQNLNINKASS
jgi:hypothetical protein